jgi:hypothetical protein
MFVCRAETIDRIDGESIPLGTSRDVRPLISELALEPGLIIIIYTDGLTHAGSRRGTPMDVRETIQSILEDENPAHFWQTLCLRKLLRRMRATPWTILCSGSQSDLRIGDNVRRVSVRLPIEGHQIMNRWSRFRAGWRDTLILINEFKSPLLFFTVTVVGGGFAYFAVAQAAGEPVRHWARLSLQF